MVKRVIKCLLAVGLFSFAIAQGTRAPRENPILKGMQEELSRSMEKLQLKGKQRPYFISYLVKDRDTILISASLGALMNSSQDSHRFVNVCVRIGDYKLDSSVRPDDLVHAWLDKDEQELYKEYAKVTPTQDDNPGVLRRNLWLLTDLMYKHALKRLAKKKARIAREVEKERYGDFSREKPVTYIGKEAVLQIDKTKWEKKCKRYSSIFKKHPDILISRVRFSAEAVNNYFVSSEGSRLQHGQVYHRLSIFAMTKAPDGNWVMNHRGFFGWDEKQLPSDEEVRSEIKRLIEELYSLRDAPEAEAYAGPAIIEGAASAVFLHEAIGHRLEVQRTESKLEGETFKDKIGKKITSESISVYCDPTIKEYRGMPMNGHYLFDDEGVPAQKVALIEKGVLKNFLCSRRPSKYFKKSNGHGRAQMQYPFFGNNMPVPRQSNLIVESLEPKKMDELKRMLIEECKKQGKPYGLRFVRSWGGATSTVRFNFSAFEFLPILVYKIDATTGNEELIRGAKFGGTPLVGLEDIIAAGDDYTVFVGTCRAESGDVPVGLAAPSILVRKMEVSKSTKSTQKPPVLPPPFKGKE
jgi:predicted Zn-dependent protease